MSRNARLWKAEDTRFAPSGSCIPSPELAPGFAVLQEFVMEGTSLQGQREVSAGKLQDWRFLAPIKEQMELGGRVEKAAERQAHSSMM